VTEPTPAARPPEVLAPAGGHPQLTAAIEAGADAVYFGLTRFSARARAANFLPEELPDVMGQLHERGVRGFVALNTLVFDEELDEVERYVELLAAHEVDAVIVQDLGLLARIRQIHPDLSLHASTQMTLTSPESAAMAGKLGARRVVLGRELCIDEISAVVEATPLEVEVFVHGALCVSYSGQCFSSEAWGGRSANRGRCAQSCRLPYGLVVDGQRRNLDDVSYLLSPQDLLGVRHIPQLVQAGVAALKIEGRLKGPEYVASTTRTYRAAVDAAWRGERFELDLERERELTQVFSRGLTPGWLDGPRHQTLVAGRFPRHRGVRVGRVVDLEGRGVRVQLEGPVKPGDGLVFDRGRPQESEVGGTVNTVLVDGEPARDEVDRGEVLLRFGPKMQVDSIGLGDKVWRTRDPAMDARLRPLWEGGVQRRIPLVAHVLGRAGEPLELVFIDPEDRQGRARSEQPLEAARSRRLDDAALRVALDRLGATPFSLAELRNELDGDLFLPLSDLNRTRRDAADDLLGRRRSERVPVELAAVPEVSEPSLGGSGPLPALDPCEPAISLLCRSREQVEAALELPELDEIAVDFLEVRGLREAIRAVQATGRKAVAVSPRVLKPKEEGIRSFLLGLGADAILVRSLGLLHSLLGERDLSVPALHGDFSLNAANQRTVRLLLHSGLHRLAPTHDLDADQLCALSEAEQGFGGRLELVIHHHLPIFHTEHCVFARFLSDGEDRTTCGQPCEHHEVHLQSTDGRSHLVRADLGCRNTVFNAEAQSGLRWLDRFVAAGYRRFRVELADHRPDEVAPIVHTYAAALRGELPLADAWRQVSEGRFGLTQGSLKVLQEERELKAPGWQQR
jgi:U32 family peptidase